MRRPQNSGFGGLLSGKYNVINLCNVVSGFGGDCNERNKRYDMIQTAKHDYLKKYEYIDTLLFFRTTLHLFITHEVTSYITQNVLSRTCCLTRFVSHILFNTYILGLTTVVRNTFAEHILIHMSVDTFYFTLLFIESFKVFDFDE